MSLQPIGYSFVYIETSGNNYGQIVFVSFVKELKSSKLVTLLLNTKPSRSQLLILDQWDDCRFI